MSKLKLMKIRIGQIVAILGLCGGLYAQEEERVPPPPPPGIQKCIVQEEIIDFPDVEAHFPGGAVELRKFLTENFRYPEKALENGDVGRVYVKFIVEKDGSITNAEVMRGGLTPELNTEALRLILIMPKWLPAEKGGKIIRSVNRLPVTFHIQ